MADDAANEELDEIGKSKKGGKLKMIIIIVVGILLIAGLSVFATWFLLKDKMASPENGDINAIEMTDPSMAVSEGPAEYFDLEPAFIINYNTGGRSRYLQVELSVLTRDTEALAILELHSPLIRNNLLEVFSTQQIGELTSAEGKEMLAQELTSAVQTIVELELGRPGIETVLYRSFIIQ